MLIELGFSSAMGNESIAQCEDFKQRLWRLIGRNAEGAFLKTIYAHNLRGIGVEYDSGETEAAQFAAAAEHHAEQIWRDIHQESATGIHVLRRSGR